MSEDKFKEAEEEMKRRIASGEIQLYDGEIKVTHAIPTQLKRGLPSASDAYVFEGDDPDGTREFMDEVSDFRSDRNIGYRGFWLSDIPEMENYSSETICIELSQEYDKALGLSEEDDVQKRALDYTIALNLEIPPHKEDPEGKSYHLFKLLKNYYEIGIEKIKKIFTGEYVDEDFSEKTAIAFQEYAENLNKERNSTSQQASH